MPVDQPVRTARTRVRRMPKRGHYDRATVHAVLDAGVMCHVGYVIDGQPYVTPTCHWRHGDRALLARLIRQPDAAPPEAGRAGLRHRHPSGRLRAGPLRLSPLDQLSLGDGARAMRGLVPDEAKLEALRDFVERLFPGRWDELRPPTAPGDQGHDRPLDGPGRGLGQDPHRTAGRRRGGLRAAGLGRRPAGIEPARDARAGRAPRPGCRVASPICARMVRAS